MTDLIRLRDLPGVQRITDICRNPRNFDYPHDADTAEEIDKVSIGLFGITQWDTLWHDGDCLTDEEGEELPPDGDDADLDTRGRFLRDRAAWEVNFIQTQMPWPDVEPFWRVIGWDISDGAGNELISAHCFARQIIAAEGDLVDAAKLTVDGSGTWTAQSQDAAEESMEVRLKREADAFIASRPRRAFST